MPGIESEDAPVEKLCTLFPVIGIQPFAPPLAEFSRMSQTQKRLLTAIGHLLEQIRQSIAREQLYNLLLHSSERFFNGTKGIERAPSTMFEAFG